MMTKSYITDIDAHKLAGVKKQSFSIPYNGGDIWFEHIDGMYQYTALVLEKLDADSSKFLRPSSSSYIAFVMFETQITEEIYEKIAEYVCDGTKTFMKVCFVGLPTEWKKRFKKRFEKLVIHFTDDTEKAKEWLLP